VLHDKANIRFMILQPHASADTILRVQPWRHLYRALCHGAFA